MDPVLDRILEELRRQKKDWQWFYTSLGYTKQRAGGWKRRGVPPGEYENIADVLGKTVDWVARGIDFGESLPYNQGKHEMSESTPYTVSLYSDTKLVLAPVVEWASLETDLYKDNSEVVATRHEAIPAGSKPNTKWIVVDADLPSEKISRGDIVLITPVKSTDECKESKLHLFKTVSGSYFFGIFRRLASGFEAIPETGPALESGRHGVQVVGIKHGHIEAI